MIDNKLTPDCPTIPGTNQTNETIAALDAQGQISECSPHWAWFGISCTLLVISTLVPAMWWTLGQMQRHENDNLCCGGCPHFCCLGVAQLSHAWELIALCLGHERTEDDENGSVFRNIFTSITESAPQLYFQAYVIFQLGAYGQGFKIASICISIASLSASTVMSASSDTTDGVRNPRLRSWKGKAIGMCFIATDAAVRSLGYAMALSEPVRPYGAPTAGTFFLLCTIYQVCICRRQRCSSDSAFAVVTLPYVIPVVPLVLKKEQYRKTGLEVLLALRFLETVTFGILAGIFGETACGSGLARELAVYYSVLVANAVALIAFNCCVAEDGTLSTPRASAYSPRRILGRAMDSE